MTLHIGRHCQGWFVSGESRRNLAIVGQCGAAGSFGSQWGPPDQARSS